MEPTTEKKDERDYFQEWLEKEGIEAPEVRDAFKFLGIEDYYERAYNSNSHGELFHLFDYVYMARRCKRPELYRKWFVGVVKWAEETWERPESIFQHIYQILREEANASYERLREVAKQKEEPGTKELSRESIGGDTEEEAEEANQEGQANQTKV